MNRFVLSALALATTAGAAAATSTGSAPQAAEEWLSLDREIESLAATLPAQDEPGFEVSGWIATSYQNSSDQFVDLNGNGTQEPGENDLGGFQFNGIRINFKGSVGGYDLKISVDGKDGTVKLRDAYARFEIAEGVHAQLGQMKSRFLFSSFSSDEKKVMYDRTSLGGSFSERDPGVSLEGAFEMVKLILQAQNGNDGTGDELALTAKAIVTVLGSAIEKQSGGYGPDAETALTLGAGWIDDGVVSDASAVSAEAIFTSGPFYAHAEVIDADSGFGAATINSGPVKKNGFSNQTPYTATIEYMLDEQWAGVLRYEDDDDSLDTARIRAGVNLYLQGHATKWQLNYTTTSSDDPALEVDTVLLGLVVVV